MVYKISIVINSNRTDIINANISKIKGVLVLKGVFSETTYVFVIM